MNVNFSMNGVIDPLAAYAAILSTLIAIWEFLKWRNRHSIRLSCNPNMEFFPTSDNKTYIIANVINTGETPTTITHFLGYYWESWFHKLFKSNTKAFIVSAVNVPAVVQPGGQWMGQVHQDENIEKMAHEGLLYIGVVHSMRKREVLQRLKINKKAKES